MLGGGGPVGRAWQTGLVDGFAERGVDLGTADLIVGTSAGAIVGARLAMRLGSGGAPATAAIAVPAASIPSRAMADLVAAMARAAESPEPELVRAEIGRMAVDAKTVSEEDSVARSTFEPFVGRPWPERFRATAVNARTGHLKIWDASHGVPLHRAVAASTAVPGVWPPVTIDGDRYIDGGVRSMLNADAAVGLAFVVVVSCFPLAAGYGPKTPLAATSAALLAELDTVRASGAALALIQPHSAFLAITGHGAAMMDDTLAPESYRLGREQALADADHVSERWNAG